MPNKIWVYAISFNESHFVKNFLAAYKDAERIVVYDNFSTDNTRELLSEDPRVEVRTYDSGGQIRNDLFIKIKNNEWKEARGKADWVIVVDFDEIFQHVVLKDKEPVFDLDMSWPYDNGYTIIRPFGYNMSSLDAPIGAEGHPFLYCQHGDYNDAFEKMCCFRPDQVEEIHYIPGCHSGHPKGNVKILWHRDYKLLHYKSWNLEHFMERMVSYKSRLSDEDKISRAGWQYYAPLEQMRNQFINGSKRCKYLFDIERDNSCGPNNFYKHLFK